MNAKGPADQYGFGKLRAFVCNHNVGQMLCRCDQENSLVAAIEHVVDSLRREGFRLVFDKSPVGESQSNGVAERTVQSVEDLLRTLRGAFIGHNKMRVPMDHPAMLWLIEHTASIFKRFVVGDDGQTAHQRLHGRRANKKAVEFGEKLLLHSQNTSYQDEHAMDNWDVLESGIAVW